MSVLQLVLLTKELVKFCGYKKLFHISSKLCFALILRFFIYCIYQKFKKRKRLSHSSALYSDWSWKPCNCSSQTTVRVPLENTTIVTRIQSSMVDVCFKTPTRWQPKLIYLLIHTQKCFAAGREAGKDGRKALQAYHFILSQNFHSVAFSIWESSTFFVYSLQWMKFSTWKL